MRPSNKAARLDAIRQSIREHRVSSQSQLSELLIQQGINVTQATLSRDLDELHATKVRFPDGIMAYWIPDISNQSILEMTTMTMTRAEESAKADQYLAKVLTGLITSVKRANNLLVVRTRSGAAQFAASALDRQPISGIMGTIAGDDTVLIISPSDDQAADRARWLLDITSDDVAQQERQEA